MCREDPICIIGGDMNIDRHHENDPGSRREIKPLIQI